MIALAACFAVGLCIGWTGIAGFLLPVLFMDYRGLPASSAMAVSFLCFAIGGFLGAMSYHKRGLLEAYDAICLGAGSLAGASAGALLGRFIPQQTMKIILYLVVFASGASILLREARGGREGQEARAVRPVVLVLSGLVTGFLCALSGAGGPVIVMPLLMLLGYDAKRAVAAALLDSVFIAIPPVIIYGGSGGFTGLTGLTVGAVAFHAAGVLLGGASSQHIRQRPLKLAVAVFSVVFPVAMLVK